MSKSQIDAMTTTSVITLPLKEYRLLQNRLERAEAERDRANNRVACVNCKQPVDVTALNAIRCSECERAFAWCRKHDEPEPCHVCYGSAQARIAELEAALRPFAVTDEDAPNPEMARRARVALGVEHP